LVRKLEGRKPLTKQRCRLADNINMDLGEISWGVVDWIGLALNSGKWRALVNAVINLSVP
jgi:hypothetical protein